MSAVPPQLVADRYRLVEPLGQGGMGRVWKARDEVLHRDVAIKELVPPPGLTDQERREMRERSLREARAIARLNHTNVVRVFDVLRTDGDPWIVMEYVPSRSLQDVLAQNGPVPATRAAEIGLGVLGALRSAHLSGVMHRDVKPGNVLLGHDGRVVLTDFGLATVPGDPNVTRTGLVLGSPAYIAPERARTGSAGPEGDLWSLGATLYAAVEGQSPYARQTAIATLSALATEPPPPARRAGPLKPVLAGLLRKDPYTRMKADEAERLLTRAAGRGPRRGRSLLDGVRRPSPYGSREVRPGESRSGIVPGPRGGTPRTPVPSEPVSPPVAPLPTALPVVPGPAKYGPPVTRPTNSADPTRVVPPTDQPAGAATAAAGAAETSVLPTKSGEPPSETTVLPQAERTQVVPGRKETAPSRKPAERAPAAEPAEQPAVEQPAAAKAAEQPTATAKAAEQPTATKQPTVAEPAERPPVQEQPESVPAATASDRRNWSIPALLLDRAARAVRSVTKLPRTWLIGGVAAVVVLALLVTVALLATGDEDEPDGQLGTGPAASATPSAPAPTSGAPSAEPSVEPSSPAAETSPEVPAVPPQSDESPQPPDPQSPLPDGWRLHEDQTGFSVPVPEGWSVSRERTRVEFRENGRLGRLIIIDQTDNPKPDPVADWQNQEQTRRGTYNNYERVRIEAVDYFLDAADWEFRYTSNQGNRLQVRNRGFVTAPDKAYSIYWSTTAERWQQDLVYFELMASRFQPAGS
ncbi:protein kinase domain-containing protein [Solwaraspora sp. WMMB762]|uniref:serine/threonine-protein kinase n=1 Tax=Solwaraspora sp. WMMB762 TaxID=3404120 RepID=UPI003B94D029